MPVVVQIFLMLLTSKSRIWVHTFLLNSTISTKMCASADYTKRRCRFEQVETRQTSSSFGTDYVYPRNEGFYIFQVTNYVFFYNCRDLIELNLFGVNEHLEYQLITCTEKLPLSSEFEEKSWLLWNYIIGIKETHNTCQLSEHVFHQRGLFVTYWQAIIKKA